MTPPASTAAGDVYEITTDTVAVPTNWLRQVFQKFTRVGSHSQLSGAVVLSVQERLTGTEVFRHIEEAGDDEDHVLPVIQRDLAQMTAAEFKARWAD